MKDLIVIIAQSLVVLSAFCQDTIKINFLEANPIWTHCSIDKTNEFGNKYQSLQPKNILVNNENVYLLNSALSPNGDQFGYIIENLNIKNGIKLWDKYNTFYNNKLSQEVINLKEINSKNELILLGLKRNGILSINPGINDIWQYTDDNASVVLKKIDSSNGSEIEHFVCPDSLESIGSNIQTFLNSNSEICAIRPDVIYTTDPINPINFGFICYPLDSELNLYLDNDTIKYQTSDTLDIFSIERQLPILQISENVLVAFVYQDYHIKDKHRLQLIWMDISDVYNVRVVRRQNYESLVPSSYSNLSKFQSFTSNNQIVISHDYNNDNLQSYLSYLLWLDENGNVNSYISECRIQDHFYDYIKPISADKSELFVLGFPSRTNRNGFDILKVSVNSDTLQYISSLTCPQNEIFYAALYCQLLQDGKLIIGGHNIVTNGSEIKRRVQFHCFNGKDLGINFSLSTEDDLTVKGNKFTLYPNPTNGIIRIEGLSSSASLDITNINGQFINGVEATNNQVDLSRLPNGIYILKIESSNTIEQHKILKID